MPQDALDLLKQDHRAMKKILNEIDATSEGALKTREELLATMKDELTIHERIEEEIFYPALRGHEKAKEIVLEGYEEHHAVDMLMDELARVPADDETWAAKFTVIRENIEHHIEEEEGEMFNKARQVLSSDELAELGAAMKTRKEEGGRKIKLEQEEAARR